MPHKPRKDENARPNKDTDPKVNEADLSNKRDEKTMPHKPKKDEHDTKPKVDSTDPFDLSRLRLSQDFASKVGVKKALITVPVRKPDRQSFVRVHPGAAWRLKTAILELKDERETYLVDPDLWPEIPSEVKPHVLFTAINRQGVVFLWPVRLPGDEGRDNAWNNSALEAADLATQGWVRVASNMNLGAYEVFQATAELPEPEWPEQDFQSLLKIAFRGHYIQSLDHPAIRRLRGEI